MTDDPERYELLEDESFEYDGDVVLAKKGGGGGGDTKTQQEPWGGVQPYLRNLYARTNVLGQSYGGTGGLFVPDDPFQKAGQREMWNLARNPLGGVAPWSVGEAQRTLAGDYLYGGEGFNAALEAATAQITPQISGQFARSGTYGGGLHQASQAREIGRAFAGLYGDERQRQMQALGMAPSIEQLRYQPSMMMQQVGAQRRAERERFRQAPWESIQRTSSIYEGYPAYTTTQQAPGISPFAGAMGGAMIGGSFGPLGALGGAVLGGLLS